jgi:hypothetical protein
LTQKTIFITALGAGTFVAPGDWPASNVADAIYCIGGGGAGQESNNEPGEGPGGAAAAFAPSTNVTLLNGANLFVGNGGQTAGAAGQDTWIGGSSFATSLVGAKAGAGAGTTAGQAAQGGQASACICNGTAQSGGNGSLNKGVSGGGGGGGGAGGPNGPGGQGGNNGGASANGGGGGGAADGGTNGGTASSPNGAPGGTIGGAGNGTGGTSGTPNGGNGTTAAGGGGLNSGASTAGGNGGSEALWTQTSDSSTAGPGSGGGGSGQVAPSQPGNGGLYGGGGAGSGDGGLTTFGKGAQGIIVILYTPSGGGPAAVLASAAAGQASLGAQIGAPWAAQMAAKATWTDLAWLSSRMGAIASAQPSNLLNWASITLTAPLYQGLGGALDGYLWTIATPKVGTVVYYDPANMSIASDGSITATSNNFSALIGFYDPSAGWQSALYTISPGEVGYAIGYASLTATLSGNLRPLAAAASDLANFAASLSSTIKLSGAAGGIASGAAALTAGVALADHAAALASISAALTTGVALADAAAGLARATIAMQTAVQAATLAAGLASAGPALSTHIQLAAQAAGIASGTPTLTNTVAATLAASAGDIASAAINLSTKIAAISAPNAIASSQPFLTTPKPLLAAASGLASGSFAMRTGAGFQTLAAGLSSGAAALQTQGAFASLGRAIASMSASLFTLPVLTMPILLAHQIPGIYQPGPFPQGQFQIGAGTESVFGIDWTYWICFLWQPGYSAALNYVIRPFPWTGLQYICTTAGQTGNYPPIWPEEVGQLVVDGSVVWTAEAIDNTSLQTTVVSATYSAPAGITASPYAVAGQVTPVAINASAATPGQTYEVVCTALMASGDFLIGQLIFDVN